jgi:hypothetical protein
MSISDTCGSRSIHGGSLPSPVACGADVHGTFTIGPDRLRPTPAKPSTTPATLAGSSRRSCGRCRQGGRVSVGIAKADSFSGVLATSPATRSHPRIEQWPRLTRAGIELGPRSLNPVCVRGQAN